MSSPKNSKVSPHKKNSIASQEVVLESSTFSGPIPPPGVLKEYENILEGSAHRILAMAEKQSSHRRDIEKRTVRGNIFKEILGLFFAFSIVVLAIGGAIFLLANGKTLGGLTTLISSLIGLTGLFLYAKKHSKK